jgi:hypothetical protein
MYFGDTLIKKAVCIIFILMQRLGFAPFGKKKSGIVVVTGNYSRERVNTRDVFWWTGQARRL